MDCSKFQDSPVTTEMLRKWQSALNAFPLPPHVTPTGGAPLASVDPTVLMTAPPQLIAHVQRTASQGGLQVISPRQTPFSSLMVRRSGETKRLGDHEVGSISNPKDEWPTLDNFDFSQLLPDEPIAPMTDDINLRPKTKTITLTKSHDLLSDPVLSCLIKGRAVIDILKRDDVAGGAEEMTSLLAAAWGVEEDEIMELEAYSLGIEGDLQRHAMKVDEVYPVLYAPTHIRSVISMGVSDMDKTLLPAHTAIDWRRVRVFCEAVYHLCCNVECLPVKYMRGYSNPGDPSNEGRRQNMIIFGPAPAIAWSYAPATFSIIPVFKGKMKKKPAIPQEVRLALQNYTKSVRPVSYLLAGGKKVDTWRTSAHEVADVAEETLKSSYARILGTMTTGNIKGRRSSTAVRNMIYEVINGSNIFVRTRMMRYLTLAPEECRTHLGREKVPDDVIHTLAQRFSDIGFDMRKRLSSEAERRGTSIGEWWKDMLAQAPGDYSSLAEGTFGWAKLSVWMLFNEPSDRWAKLKYALKVKTLSAAARDSVGAVSLPSEKGSVERLLAAARVCSHDVSRAFAGYYLGVADVGYAVAKAAERMRKSRTALILREGAHLWTLRARALRAINVAPIAHDEAVASVYHIRLSAQPVDIVLKPAPYMALKAWLTHIMESEDIPQAGRAMVKNAVESDERREEKGARSQFFQLLDRPIFTCVESKVTKYLLKPHLMAEDWERAWNLLSGDVKYAISMVLEETRTPKVVRPRPSEVIIGEDLSDLIEPSSPKRMRETELGPRGKPLRDFWEVYGEEGEDIAMGLQDEITRLPEEVADLFWEGQFEDVRHVQEHIAMWEGRIITTTRATGETVR